MARRLASNPALRAAIFAIWGEACIYCDAPAKQVDHVIALSKQGTNLRENLRPCCAKCNRAKGVQDPYNFMASLGYTSAEIERRWRDYRLHEPDARAQRARAWHDQRRRESVPKWYRRSAQSWVR